MDDEDSVIEDIEETGEEFSLYESLKSPGALAAMGTVALLPKIPYIKIGVIPPVVADLILKVFSVPVLFVFLFEVALNRNINIQKNIPLLLGGSFLVFVLEGYLYQSYLFPLGLTISFAIIFTYYLFHRLSPKIEKIIPGRQGISKRFLFFSAYLPTVMISIALFAFLTQKGVFQILLGG